MISEDEMIEYLMGCIDEIEESSDWEYRFVCDISEKLEAGEPITDRQFDKLSEIYDEFG